MEITNVIESLEAVRNAMVAMKADRDEAAKYLSFIESEVAKLAAQEKELVSASVGGWKGRSEWKHEQVMNARFGIRSCTGKFVTVGEICEALPFVDRALIERELDFMIKNNSIKWNGKRGPASKYVRV